MFKKKTALITGVTQGLGRALSIRFANERYNLILVARDKSGLDIIASDLKLQGSDVHTLCADFSDAYSLSILLNHLKEITNIDVVINNAGVQGPIGSFEECDLRDWQNAFTVNFFAPVSICQATMAALKRSKGSIVNISGGGATGPRPFSPHMHLLRLLWSDSVKH